MRLIDADELRKEVISKVKRPTPHTIGSYSFREIMEIIESQPTVKLTLTVDDMPRYTHNVSVETRWNADDIKTPPFTQGMKKIIQATERLNEKCNEIDSEVNKWGRKRVVGVDDDL